MSGFSAVTLLLLTPASFHYTLKSVDRNLVLVVGEKNMHLALIPTNTAILVGTATYRARKSVNQTSHA